MPAQTLRNHSTPHQRVAPISGDGGFEDPIQRWADERALASTISGHLRNARARLDESIAECACRESLGLEAKPEDRERVASHACTKADSLKRLTAQLDRVTTRFHQVMSVVEVRYTSNSIDLGRSDLRKRIEFALAECACTLAGRFDNPDVGRIVPAELESDLSDFELALDAYAALVFLDERQGATDHAAEKARNADEKGRSHVGRDQDLSLAFKEDLNTLRQVDLALRKLESCIAQARRDRFLQQYWREVEWHYRELARQLTRRIGEEAIRIARLHRSGGA